MTECHKTLQIVTPHDLHDLSMCLHNKTQLTQNWFMFFNALHVDCAEIEHWKHQYRNGNLKMYELFFDILQCWQRQKGPQATYHVLYHALGDVGDKIAADCVKNYQKDRNSKSRLNGMSLRKDLYNGDIHGTSTATNTTEDTTHLQSLIDEPLNIESLTKSSITDTITVCVHVSQSKDHLLYFRKTLNKISNRLYELGMYPEMLKFSTLIYERLKKHLPSDRVTLLMEHNLAKALFANGCWDDSCKRYSSLWKKQKKLLPDDFAAAIAHNYTRILISRGKLGLAIEVLKESVGENEDLINWKTNLANLLREEKKWDSALRMYNQIKEWQTATWGEEHLQVYCTRQDVGLTYFKLNNFAEALKEFEAVTEFKKEKLGESHPDVSRSMYWLGITQFKLGDEKASIKTLKWARENQMQVLEYWHPHTQNTDDILIIIENSSKNKCDPFNLLMTHSF